MNDMSKKHKQKKAQQNTVRAVNKPIATMPLVKKRNAVALNPLLKKSAVHQKSTKAKRQAEKVSLKKTWFERVAALVAATGQSHVLSELT